MVFSGITATEAQIDQKSGANVSASYTGDMKKEMLLQAESYVNVATGFNWSDWYAASPNVDVKYIITEATSSLVAIEAVKYDMSGFTSRVEAEDMINVLFARFVQCLDILTEIGTETFMTEA